MGGGGGTCVVDVKLRRMVCVFLVAVLERAWACSRPRCLTTPSVIVVVVLTDSHSEPSSPGGQSKGNDDKKASR